ncbi:ATP-binding protein [Enterovibrio coralii]|uniref:histidine kinase n=1 Tax=Enterovibrio coralii TaxID=294935 RepID=A0A135I5F8_9GAMM|nr:ATP-binding protein [Enterovibrio coralii]KXF80696.1 hybrid sensor histidine kinase/response regulator [Enterovibrio coralii]
MNNLILLSRSFLALSLVLTVFAINGFVAQRQYTAVSIELTELGHDVLALRDQAVAFNSGYAITPYVLAQQVVQNERDLDKFTAMAQNNAFGFFSANSSKVEAVIERYSAQHINLSQRIDNLIALIIARDSAKTSIDMRDAVLADVAPTSPTVLSKESETENSYLERYLLLKNEVSNLLDEILLGKNAAFVENTENQIKYMALSALQTSFIYFVLALCSFIAYIFLSSWARENQLKKLNEDLTRLTEKAERANQAKTLFLATMSHELRTPMNGVLGMAELIVDETKEEITRKHAKIIGESGKHLVTILNDILDFSKVEQGKMEFEKVSFSLSQLLDPVTNSLHSVAEDKNVKLEIGSNVPQDMLFLSDSSRLRQVIFNIVGNAIKFTENGFVRITSDFDADDNWLHFWIKDSGVGIPQDKLDQIFEPFRQAESSTNRKFGGTGLGLSIVKKIITQMNGRVTVTSEVGKGTEFYISLPIEVMRKSAEQPIEVPTLHAPEEVKQVPLNVLIADDNPVNAMLAKRHCESLGHKADTVENGKLAVVALKQKNYHLVLMDKHMPVMDGVDAIRQIRNQKYRDTIIFACTADVFREAHDELLGIGANHVLTKPMQKNSLEEAIYLYLDEFEKLDKKLQQSECDEPVASDNVVALSRLPKKELKLTEEELTTSANLKAFAEEPEVVQDLLRLMVEEFERSSDNLIQAFTEHNVVKIFKTLHIVRGTAMDLGISNLARLAKDNERKAQNGNVPDSTTLQEILNLMSVNIHQANRMLESFNTGTGQSEQAQ